MLQHLAGTPPLSCTCGGDVRPLLSERQRGAQDWERRAEDWERRASEKFMSSWKACGPRRSSKRMLSVPLQCICDVVYFIRFSNDVMWAACNPFDPPIINTKISIRERTGWYGSHVEGVQLRGNCRKERKKKKKIIYFIWLQLQHSTPACMCVCLCWGGGLRQAARWGDRETDWSGTVWERKRERQKKKKEARPWEWVCVCGGGEMIRCWTAGKRKSARRTADRFLPRVSQQTHFFFPSLHSSPLLQPEIFPSALHLYHSLSMVPSPLLCLHATALYSEAYVKDLKI